MPGKPVGVAMLGLGRWSRELAKSINRVDSLRLVTCYSRTKENTLKFASEFACEPALTLEAALSTPGVEAAFIAAPSHAHLELTLACASYGRHVFVEKPMAISLSEARQMAAVCQEQGLVLMVGHEMRRLGSSRAMKQVVNSGRLGQIVTVMANQTLAGMFYPDNWRCHRDTNRGGALMQLGIHQIETLLYLMGPVVTVSGFFAHRSAPADIDDVGAAYLTFESGAIAMVASSYVSPTSYGLHFYGDRANMDCVADMRVWPDSLKVDPNTNLTVQTSDEIDPVIIEPQDVLAIQADEFARSVRGLTQPETGSQEGLAALAVVEAALKSFETGKPVSLQSV